jgi:hypothetical protein
MTNSWAVILGDNIQTTDSKLKNNN